MREVFIVQRQTLDWAALDLEGLRSASIEFCRRLRRRDDFVYRLAKLWNDTFRCGYLETRARIKAISEQHNASIDGTRFIPFEENTDVTLDAAGYVFIDDDDWFSPALGTALAPYTGRERNFLLWRTTNIGSPNQEFPVFYWGLNGRCMTNNYMATWHWIREQGSLDRVFWHKSAIQVLEKEPDLQQLDVCLSVANKGPISSMSLIRGLGDSREPSALREMVEQYLRQMETVTAADLAHVSWAAPLLDATIQVYRDVFDSRIERL